MAITEHRVFLQDELESAADEPDEEVNEPVDVEKPKKSAKRKSDTAIAAPKKKARTEKAKPNENAKVKDSSKKAKGQRVVRSAVCPTEIVTVLSSHSFIVVCSPVLGRRR